MTIARNLELIFNHKKFICEHLSSIYKDNTQIDILLTSINNNAFTIKTLKNKTILVINFPIDNNIFSKINVIEYNNPLKHIEFTCDNLNNLIEKIIELINFYL